MFPEGPLAARWRGADPGGSDATILLRHLLRRESERLGASHVVRLPEAPANAGRFGLRVSQEADGAFVAAEPWRPDWADGPVDATACREEGRRTLSAAGGLDPFLADLGFPAYRSRGQEAAVRAALAAPPGSTLATLLNTGSGKSLVARALAETRFPGDHGTVVVVVPTVALALDQARDYGIDSAYVSGEEGRGAIRAKLRAGEQKVLFTSPEALMGSLRPVLYEAAGQGWLYALVVDEAHLAAAWGDDFRPEFQILAGLRRSLMRLCPSLRTVLMTATLPPESLGVLRTLFGDPGPFRVVSELGVRPEPEYWMAPCPDEATRRGRIFEALDRLPRPLVLYTTKVADADRWFIEARARGFQRAGLVTGETSTHDRKRVVEGWARRDIDLVVATSAFGVGIDQPDVRAVVHACVPESLDRFYQEVGRGGRDGVSCVSVMLHTPLDLRIAERMAGRRTISRGRAHQRWLRMFDAADVLGERRRRVDLRTSPGVDPRDLEMRSRRNESWNAATLTLMARAGLIEMDGEPPDEAVPPRSQVVRVPSDDHALAQAWAAVDAVRNRAAAEDQRGIALLRDAMLGTRCVGEAVVAGYRVRENGVRIDVAYACGGCPACRAAGRRAVPQAPRPPHWPWPPAATLPNRAATRLASRGTGIVWLPSGLATLEVRRNLARAVERALDAGYRRIVADPPDALPASVGKFLRERRTFVEPYPPSGTDVPTLYILPARREIAEPLPKGLVFLPADAVSAANRLSIAARTGHPDTSLAGFVAMEDL